MVAIGLRGAGFFFGSMLSTNFSKYHLFNSLSHHFFIESTAVEFCTNRYFGLVR